VNAEKRLTLLGHGLTGWALCAATMGIGMAVTSLENTLIIHAIAAPVFFAIVSFVYFRYFNYTAPLETALIFLALVVGLDFFVVALLVTQSLDMFRSLLGTWIPFALIFAATYLTGLSVTKGRM
jgi:hypothetical protein